MGLSSHGMPVLKRVLFVCFDEKSIDRVSQCLSSNPAETFFGIVSKILRARDFVWSIPTYGYQSFFLDFADRVTSSAHMKSYLLF